MKNIFISVLVFISLTACTSTRELTKKRTIDAIMSRYDKSDQPGASVLVLKDNKIVFKKGYGVRNIQTQEKITPNTNFRLASVTKQFTAMSILLLEKQKRLSLNDRLTKYFENFPDYGKNITLKHLLTHSSGLIDYEDLMPSSQKIQLHDTNCLQLMYTTDKLYFPSGTSYQYSNTGYAILALVVEKVSGKDFATFLKENIFKPLRMKTSIAYEEGKSEIANRAYGNSFENKIWTQTDQSLTSAVLGDGGIYSNTIELSKWIQALWHFKLIPEAMQQRAWSRTTLENGRLIQYGYGWHVEDFKNTSHPFHEGSSIGFRNSLLFFPEQKLMVVILTNRNEHDPIEEAKKIAELYWP